MQSRTLELINAYNAIILSAKEGIRQILEEMPEKEYGFAEDLNVCVFDGMMGEYQLEQFYRIKSTNGHLQLINADKPRREVEIMPSEWLYVLEQLEDELEN